MKNIFRCCVFFAALAAVVPQAAAGELKLSMQDGRVSIVADNVPLRQILQEWARVGQTTILNGDKLSGPNISLQLTNVPEREALDILLRSAAGYIAAPRPTIVAGAATYDRITIMATSRAPAAMASAPVPTFQRPPAPVDDGDEPINVTMPPMQPQPQPQNPVVGQYPGMPPAGMQPPGVMPNANMPVTATQPGPLTSPRPGALPAPAMPPAGYPNPYQQPPVVRPGPGGGPGGPGGGPGGPGQ